MSTIDIYSPLHTAQLHLRNRIAMAPLTRSRATADYIPTPIMAEYYCQRTESGLIVSEASPISPMGIGYVRIPGMYSQAQVEAWKPITAAIHASGGKIFAQLWHVGRNSHPDFLNGELPVSASDIPIKGFKDTPSGKKEYVAPRPLKNSEIQALINDYVNAAQNAIAAGFDGVEIHGANGYIIDQFICDGTNHRTDNYGGSVQNRARLAIEVTEAVSQTIGSQYTAIRFSPSGTNGQMYNSTPVEVFDLILTEISKFDLAYVCLNEPQINRADLPAHYPKYVAPAFRDKYKGTLMTNGGYNLETAQAVVSNGHADVVAFGKLFISNPDLVSRFRNQAPLNEWDNKTFYDGGPKGYTDYPILTL